MMTNDEIRKAYEKENGPFQPRRNAEKGMSSQEFTVILLAFVLLLILVFWILASVTVFEDGSFILGPLSGCLPWGICQ